MFSDEVSEKIVELFPGTIIEANERKFRYFDGTDTISCTYEFWLNDMMPDLVQIDYNIATKFGNNKKEVIQFFKHLFSKKANEYSKNKRNKNSSNNKSQLEYLKECIPYMDLRDVSKIILVHKDTLKRSPYDWNLLNTKLGWDLQDINMSCKLVKLEYNPRREEKEYEAKQNGDTFPHYNLYNKPEWMEIEVEEPTLHPLFIKFFKHLFPIEEERDYVMDWLYKSLTDRAYVYLVLNGVKGVGKNTFKMLFRALHGKENFVDGKKTLLTSQFNGQLDECRALVLDEVRYTEEEENILKEIQNDNVSIERKGEDATRGSVIHCSMVLMNNEAKDNFIAVDSRRFSPMQLGDKPLTDSMSEEDIDLLLGKLKEEDSRYDLDFIANIGHWILQNGRNERWGKEAPYKGPKFYELVQTSLSEWRKFLVKKVAELRKDEIYHEGFLLSELAEEFHRKYKGRKIFPDFTRVLNFVEYYRDNKGKRFLTYRAIDDEEIDYEILAFDPDTEEEEPKAYDPGDDLL
jgi:hypothetical protein